MTIEELKTLIREGDIDSIDRLEEVEVEGAVEAYRDRLVRAADYYNSKREERRNEAIIDWFSENYNGEVDIPYIVNHLGEDISSMDDIVADARDMGLGEIIYYSDAIKYLAENDPSLRESLEIADEIGYTTDKLNSELLASLLNAQNIISDLEELSSNFEDFLEEYDENHPEL